MVRRGVYRPSVVCLLAFYRRAVSCWRSIAVRLVLVRRGVFGCIKKETPQRLKAVGRSWLGR